MIRFLVKLLLVGLVLGGLSYAAYGPAVRWWAARNRPVWRQAEVVEGDLIAVVNSTGTIKPVRSVQVGSFVSGPIVELYADFNRRVMQGELLAKIDPRLFAANVARERASLATREAEIQRVEALLQQAINDERRALTLRAEDPNFISQSEMDQYKFSALSLRAQLAVAEASLEQARANLTNAEANLDYTDITSPVDGIVIDRKIDPGQTLAAQFQTPELFVVAPDMEQKMHVFASVDEADIGQIKEAQARERPVSFTVDAYPEEIFAGQIEQVRVSSTTTQNVVTYPVVVAASNPELKLLPGMTANLSFEVDRRLQVVKVPNAALRFYPQANRVHPDDRHLLSGEPADGDQQEQEGQLPADALVDAQQQRRRRHVWVLDGDLLRAKAIITGLSDHRYTEVLDGDVQPGQQLVTGVEGKK